MTISWKEVLGLIVAIATIGGRFYLLEERVEVTRQTCATLIGEVKELSTKIYALELQLAHETDQKAPISSPQR